jgi:hypothetical protein
MTDLDDLPFDYPSEANPAAPKPKCRAHLWINLVAADGCIVKTSCQRCGRERNEDATRRGRNNRSRGNSIEREIGKRLGLRRVGQFGGPEDLMNDLFAAQVKSGGAFSERLWGWLKQVPVKAGQTALLVVADAPGPGRRRRGVVIVDIDDWEALHGRDAEMALEPDPYLEGLK